MSPLPAADITPLSPTLAEPPGAGTTLIRYMVGFGVSVAVGLAPLLGLVDVPGFVALLSLYPDALRHIAIPVSAALMGVVAVAVQWHLAQHVAPARLTRAFRSTLVANVVFVIAVVVANVLLIERFEIPHDGATRQFAVVKGWVRPASCTSCPPDISDRTCLEGITLDEARVADCWGTAQVAASKLVLLGTYLAFMATFGALVGLVVVGEGAGSRSR